MILNFLIQLESDKDFLIIYDGGSDQSEMITRMTGKINETSSISIAGNQMLVDFNTNEAIAKTGFYARIIEGTYVKYFLVFCSYFLKKDK